MKYRLSCYFRLALKFAGLSIWGDSVCIRRIAEMSGGIFEGPKLRGTVLPAGGDWIIIRPDKIMQLDLRVTLKTDDDEFQYI